MLGRVGLTESVAPDSDAAFATFGGSDERAAFSDATDLATVVLRTFSLRDLVALLVVSVVGLRVVEADTDDIVLSGKNLWNEMVSYNKT